MNAGSQNIVTSLHPNTTCAVRTIHTVKSWDFILRGYLNMCALPFSSHVCTFWLVVAFVSVKESLYLELALNKCKWTHVYLLWLSKEISLARTNAFLMRFQVFRWSDITALEGDRQKRRLIPLQGRARLASFSWLMLHKSPYKCPTFERLLAWFQLWLFFFFFWWHVIFRNFPWGF